MNNRKSEIMSPVKKIESQIWQIIDTLRGKELIEEVGPAILYLLSAYRNDIISNAVLSDPYTTKHLLFQSISDANREIDYQYRAVGDVFNPIIDRLDVNVLERVIRSIFEIEKSELSQHYSEIFDSVIFQISKSSGRYGGEYIQPIEITRFINNLVDLPPNSRVFNPFAGLASFGVHLEKGQSYLGQEINRKTWALAVLRLMAYNKTESSKFDCCDSVNEWPSDSERFDLIIANPPFSIKLNSWHQQNEFGAKTLEQFLIMKGLHSLNYNGKLIAVLPQGFLFRGSYDLHLRKHLIDNDLIDTIISIPGGLFANTSIPLVILVLNRSKKLSRETRLVDAKDFIQKDSSKRKVLDDAALFNMLNEQTQNVAIRIVSKEEVIECDYNLSIQRYFINIQRDFSKLSEGINLSELGLIIKGPKSNDGQTGKFIRVKDLKDEQLDFELTVGEIEDTILPKNAQCIQESCIIMALRWKTLKPTYFNYNGVPIFIGQDLIAYRFDENKVDQTYLISELNSANVSQQLDALRTGTIIPSLKIKDLLSVIISLPSLTQQKSIAKLRLMEQAEGKKKIHDLESEIIEQNTYLRHTLAGPSSNLKDSIANIRTIFENNIMPTYPELINLKISEKHLVTLGEYLFIIARDAAKIVSAVTSQLKVDTGFENKKLEPIEFIEFLQKYSTEYNERAGLNFHIDFDFDKEAFMDGEGNRIRTFISANEDLLRDLFDNLVDNAIKHAFSQNDNNRIDIYLMKGTDIHDQDEIVILFSNTGKPFSSDFTFSDFIRKGSKSGANSGDGFGGWYINSIVKKLNGDLDIIDETGLEGLPETDLATSFEIKLPITQIEENE